MKGLIESNGELYIIKRSFKVDGWFDRAVKELNVDDILKAYNCDKILKDTNGMYHIVNQIKNAEII